MPEDGWVVGCGDEKRVRSVLESVSCRTRTYGLEPQNEVRAEDISYDENGCALFTATLYGHPLTDVELQVPGEHNVKNALAVIAVASLFSLPMSLVAETLHEFRGVHRRYELTSVTDGVRVYQDYGHNPTETRNVLHVARIQAPQKLWAVLQPHTYSRVKTLFQDYIHCCDLADDVLVTDIFAAREKDPGDIHATMLVEAMQKEGVPAHYTPTFDDAEAYLRAHWQPGDLVITMSCGNINLLNDQLQKHGEEG